MAKFRFPLVGSINTRVGVDDLLTGQSGVVGEAIVGIAIVGNAPEGSDKDQRMINCFPVVFQNPFSEQRTAYLVKRPGWVAHSTPQAGSVGSAILVWSGQGTGGKVISAFGGTNSSIYDATSRLTTNAADTTAITGKATGITETSLSGTATLLISSSDSTAWYYQDAGTVTKVTNGYYPGNAGKTIVGTFAHLDGYAFIMTSDGKIYNTDVNSVTSWGALSYIATNAYPDAGIGCFRWRNYIVGFGPQTLEVFQNAGNPSGSILTRRSDMTQKIGLCNANACAASKDLLFFVGSSPEGGLSVYQFSGELFRISTPSIESKLVLAGPSQITVQVTNFFGTTHVVVRASTATFVFCLDSQTWYEWTGNQSVWDRISASSTGTTVLVYSLSTTVTGGKVYLLNPSARSFQDDGAAYSATFITAPIDVDSNKKKRWESMSIIGDVSESTSNITVSWSDDDYQSFDASRTRTVSMSGGTARIYRLGMSRQRIFRFDHSDNVPLRIRAVELEYSEHAV